MIVRDAMVIFQRLEMEGKMPGNIVSPNGGEGFDFGGFGVRWKIAGADSDQRFAVVHHPIAARTLAAPLHRHHREDEYSYIVRGTMGALLGDEVVVAKQGAWVFKPRKQWHTFWNPADEPCEIIEVISPAGFENYFREFAQVWPDRATAVSIREKYQLDMDVESVSGLCERFNLQLP
jgi:mannose-6-phosphate isomerase-like protein (cupin superfamily)